MRVVSSKITWVWKIIWCKSLPSLKWNNGMPLIRLIKRFENKHTTDTHSEQNLKDAIVSIPFYYLALESLVLFTFHGHVLNERYCFANLNEASNIVCRVFLSWCCTCYHLLPPKMSSAKCCRQKSKCAATFLLCTELRNPKSHFDQLASHFESNFIGNALTRASQEVDAR